MALEMCIQDACCFGSVLGNPDQGIVDKEMDLRNTENEPEEAGSPPHQQTFPNHSGKEIISEDSVDFTSIPKSLDRAIEKYGGDNVLRSTTIKTSDQWTRFRQENLLEKPKTNIMNSNDVKSEKDKAFDLLDALSRSGSFPIKYSDLHVIICVTHFFEKNVMDTVIQDNINPIEKLEMSTLMMSSIIHGIPAANLISNANDQSRLGETFPSLLKNDE
jgi:hypothetical protein